MRVLLLKVFVINNGISCHLLSILGPFTEILSQRVLIDPHCCVLDVLVHGLRDALRNNIRQNDFLGVGLLSPKLLQMFTKVLDNALISILSLSHYLLYPLEVT